MQATANPLAADDARKPLSWRLFLLIAVVLAIGLLAFDFAFYGPVSWLAAQRLVVEPAERDWGFHAEWRDYTLAPDYQRSLLTVVQVTPGGAFDRAGIRPGMAFAPRHSGSFGPHFGGMYSVFANRGNNTSVRMLDNPHDFPVEHMYDITR